MGYTRIGDAGCPTSALPDRQEQLGGGAQTAHLILAFLFMVLLASCGRAETAPPEPSRGAIKEQARGYYAEIAECLTDQGFTATYDSEEIRMEVQADASQAEDLQKAEERCRDIHGSPPTVPAFSDQELELVRAIRGGL